MNIQSRSEGARQITEWTGSGGTLVSITEKGHPVKYPVDSLDAVKVYRHMWEDAQYVEHDDGLALAELDRLIGPDGLFLFRNVAPGRYVIRALGETDREGASLYGASSATVENENADGIIIVLTPGAVVEGRLEFGRIEQTPARRGAFAPRACRGHGGDSVRRCPERADRTKRPFSFSRHHAWGTRVPGRRPPRTETLVDYVNGKVLSRKFEAQDLAAWKDAGVAEAVLRAAMRCPIRDSNR